MGADLGELTARLRVNTSELDSAAASLKGFSGAFDKGMAGVAVGVGAAFVGVGAVLISTAANFETLTTQLVTGAGESGKNLEMVRKGLLDMAGQVGVSANDLAKGMYMIESAGFHGAAGLTVLKVAAEGAKVGGADMATVANAITSALNAYGLTADSSAHVTNVLIATVAAGKMKMEDLAGSIGSILAPAAASHVSLEQVGAALSTMTMQGTDAAQATTYLRQLLISLDVAKPAAVKAFTAIGLSAHDVSDGLRKQPDGFLNTIQTVSEHMAKKFPEDAQKSVAEFAKVKAGTESSDDALKHLADNTSPAYIAAMKDIAGGSKQMMGILELSGGHMGTLRDNFNSIIGAAKAGGNAITGWDRVQGDFNFKLEAAKAAAGAFGIELGTKLLPAASAVAGWVAGTMLPALKDLVSEVGDKLGPAFQKAGDVFKQIQPHLKDVADKLDLVGKTKPALALLAGVIGGVFVAALISATAATIGFGVALLTNPIVLIAALVAGLILAYTECKPFRDIVNEIAKAITDKLGPAFELAKKHLDIIKVALAVLVVAWTEVKVAMILDASITAVGNLKTAIVTMAETGYIKLLYLKDSGLVVVSKNLASLALDAADWSKKMIIAFVAASASAVKEAAVVSAAWVASGVTTLAQWVITGTQIVEQFVLLSIAAASNAAKVFASWFWAAFTSRAPWIDTAVVAVASFVTTAVGAAVNAARVAAAWAIEKIAYLAGIGEKAAATAAHYVLIAVQAAASALLIAGYWVAEKVGFLTQIALKEAAALTSYLTISAAAEGSAIASAAAWVLMKIGMIASMAATTAAVIADYVAMTVAANAEATAAALAWAISFGPVGVAALAIAALVVFVATHFDQIKGIVSTVAGVVSGMLGGAFQAVTGIVQGTIAAVGSLLGLISTVGTAISHIPSLPNFGGSGGIQIPGLSGIPGFAAGTVTSGPQLAMIGDNPGGKEYVTPSQSIPSLARAIINAMGGGASDRAVQQTVNVYGSNLTAADVAHELAWMTRTGTRA